jgi:hypothetical protein
MNDDLTSSYETETGQVILEGRPAGPAGEAGLVPVAEVELAFDLADGHLVRVTVSDDSETVTALLTRLLGPDAQGIARAAAQATGPGAGTLTPEPTLCAALSSLARLDAARATSPVPRSSPWWMVEAGVLAEQAGLRHRAVAEARCAVYALSRCPLTVPAEAARMLLAAADIVSDSDAGAVRRLRDSIVVASDARQPQVSGLDVAAELEAVEKDCVRLPNLHWILDPGGLFRPGLSPHSDLLVGQEIRQQGSVSQLVVSATPTPGPPGTWHARLVDPAVRRVLAIAGFEQDGSQVRAELRLPVPLDELCETWIEVIDRIDRPVQGIKAHRMRRARRWAAAALRAERVPVGLAPRSARTHWAALAAVAWERCRRDWAAAGDGRLAAAVLAPRVPLQGPACLAEILGE